MEKIFLYNTLTRRKEEFEPINPEHVGMYVWADRVYPNLPYEELSCPS